MERFFSKSYRLFPSAIRCLLSKDLEPLCKWNSPAALCFGHHIGHFSERKTKAHRSYLKQRDPGAVVGLENGNKDEEGKKRGRKKDAVSKAQAGIRTYCFALPKKTTQPIVSYQVSS